MLEKGEFEQFEHLFLYLLMYSASFSNDEKEFIFQFVRQFNETQLKATAPTGYFVILTSKHYFSKFFYFFFRVFIGCTENQMFPMQE